MLSLANATEIAHGNDRAVFQHPEHSGRCIKVARFPERGSQQNEREKAYFEALKRRGLEDWQSVPEYFGTVETDLGEGLVFALITDSDGRVSSTIRQYRNRQDIAWLSSRAFLNQLAVLHHYLRRNWIVPSDINDRNVVCQRRTDGSVHLWLIDGVSNPDFMPLATIWPWFARQKIDRRIRRFFITLHNYGFLAEAQCERLGRCLQ